MVARRRLTGIKNLFHLSREVRGMSFDFSKSAWLQFLKTKKVYYLFPSLEAQDALQKRRFSQTASVLDESQASPGIAARVDDPYDDDEDWDSDGANCLDDMNLVGAKLRLFDFQDSCREKKCKVPKKVAMASELATKLVNKDVLAGAGSSPILVSMNKALTTAQSEAKNAQDQLGLLQ